MTATRVVAKTLLGAADLILPRLRGPRILIYHQVGSERAHEINVSVEAFRWQLGWMQSHGEIVSLEDAVKRRGEADSHRLFVVNFDDGYRDVFLNAFPLMAQQRIPFTLYLTSGPIDTPDRFQTWPGNPLTWDQVCSMIDSGLVTVGAHTHTHPDMRQMANEAVVDELDRSNDLIAKRTGVVPEHFTYPKGWWAAEAHDAVTARYLTATLGGGRSIDELSDLHMLNRVPLQRSDASRLFSQKLRGGGRTEERLRRRLHRYQGP